MIRHLVCLCFFLSFSLADAQDIEDSQTAQMAAQSTNWDSSQLTEDRFPKVMVPAQAFGDAAGPKKRFPSTTKGGEGHPVLHAPEQINVSGPKTTAYGNDVHVRKVNYDSCEKNQVMASDSEGNLYVAWEDNYFVTYSYIQIYRSADGGENWESYAYVKDPNVDLREPSIAIGEGYGDVLLLAYIRDDGVSIPVPEVASKDIDGGNWTFASVPVWSNWDGYAKPVINTDSIHYDVWFAFLTCEGIVDAGTSNINVCTWRCTDQGVTWKDEWVLFGNSDSDAWLDPDASYGTAQKDLFLVCFNDDDDSLYFAQSTNFAVSWESAKSLYTLSPEPAYPVDPEIAAAVSNNNIMIACTKSYQSNDNIGYTYSTDLGNSWSALFNMQGHTPEYECGVSLHANKAGNSWHMAWTAMNYICYSKRPQNLSMPWSPSTTVNDLKSASYVHPKKAVASVSGTDAPCICWADFRDGGLDYDTYADYPDNEGLAGDAFMIDCSEGGIVLLTLDAGADNAYRHSLIFGSVSNVSPGTPLPGGAVLPLNWDDFTDVVLELTNTNMFYNFYGQHNAEGKRAAFLSVDPFPDGPSMIVNFAFAMMHPWDYASNPISIAIVP